LRVEGVRIGLNISFNKTKSLRLGIGEGSEGILVKENIDKMNSFTYLGSIISEDGSSSEDVKK